MNELMIHVERIVRPVRAFQSRKLRMRQELLAHLQAAIDEEVRQGTDAASAFDRARARLGEPAELTRQLQRSVPIYERLMVAKIPAPRSIERLEIESARRIYGRSITTMTMSHISILAGMAGLLAGMPWYIQEPVMKVLTGAHFTLSHTTGFFLGMLISLYILIATALRFVFAASDPRKLNIRRAVAHSASILAMQIGWSFFAAAAATDRVAPTSQVALTASVTVGLLPLCILAARWVAVLRRPYEPWLGLDLAE